MESFEDALVSTPPPHYHGDKVRNLFLVAAIALLFSLLLEKNLFGPVLFFGILTLVGLVVLAGLTSPKKKLATIANTFVSGTLFVFFEYSALAGSPSLIIGTSMDIGFLLRQALAVLFLLALYFSIKTWRGMVTT